MPIAETVADLARCVAKAREPMSNWERELVSVLEEMPNFRDRKALNEWEVRFDEKWEAGVGKVEDPLGFFETSTLILRIFEFGRFNLYAGFNAGGTLGAYTTLIRELKVHHNIDAPDDLDVSTW